MADIISRIATPADMAGIRALLEAAFDGPAEADLIDALRANGDMVIDLVSTTDDGGAGGTIAGYVAFSRLVSPPRGLALAPLAVATTHRRRGIAAALVGEGLARARAGGWSSVFVLGDPTYYDRFGFRVEAATSFASPYAGPYLMALAISGDSLPPAGTSLIHASAFAAH